MTDGDSIAQAAAVIILLILAVPALSTAYDYAGTPIEYSESLTVDPGNNASVSASATSVEGYGDSPTVTVDGAALTAGVDYEWNASSGVVEWQSTTNTTDADGDSARIEYDAYQRTQESELAWAILAPFMGLFGVYAFVASVRALLQLIGEVFDA